MSSENQVALTDWKNPPPRGRARRVLALTLLLPPLLSAVGCGEPAAAVFIDNGGESTMVVRVDGQPAATIEGGQFTTIRLYPGEHRFEIQRAGRTIYEGTKTIDTAKGLGNPRQYVFNPGGEHRYASCKVIYGSQLFTDATDSMIVKFAEHQAGEKVDPTRLEFIKIKRYAEPMPGANWFELPGGISYILRDAPEAVYTRSGSTSRRVLTRISRSDHSQLRRSHRIEDPTPRDVDVLAEATINALDSMSQLEPIY